MSSSSHKRCSAKKGVLRNFTKLTGKHLCLGLFFTNLFCRTPLDDCFSKYENHFPSWHSDVVTTLPQRCCWRCHNAVTRSKMRVVPTSFSDVVTASLSDVIKTLPQRCCNIVTTFSIGFLGHFTTDYSNFFPFIETWES